jgi:hypothetical protein
MIESLHAHPPGQGFVGNHEIQAVQRQLRQQVGKLAFAANQADRLGHGQRRLQQPVGHRLRHRISHADAKLQHPLSAPGLAQRAFKLSAQGEDLVGVTQRHLTVAGELQLTAAFAKQRAAQPLLKQFDLTRQGLRRRMQLLAGAHDAPRPWRPPKNSKDA